MNRKEVRSSAGESPRPLKVIIHIGTHKTGTTSLQRFLASNEELLEQQGRILYPNIGRNKRKGYHHPLFKLLYAGEFTAYQEMAASILREAENRSCHTVLLSSEVLSRATLTDEILREIHQSFQHCEVSILVYFRQQDSYLQSIYAEKVKRGRLAAPETILDIDTDYLNYFKFTERYARVFGEHAMMVRSFDREKGPKLYQHFLSALHISEHSAFHYPVKRANVSYPNRLLEALRLTNRWKLVRFFMKRKAVLKFARTLAKRYPTYMNTPILLSEQQAEEVRARFAESNRALVERYDLESPFF